MTFFLVCKAARNLYLLLHLKVISVETYRGPKNITEYYGKMIFIALPEKKDGRRKRKEKRNPVGSVLPAPIQDFCVREQR